MVDKIWYNMEELIGGSEERGINRNILECKFFIHHPFCNRKQGINRNILECKFVTDIQNTENQQVLIETYWNVNFVIASIIGILPRINRNILECK